MRFCKVGGENVTANRGLVVFIGGIFISGVPYEIPLSILEIQKYNRKRKLSFSNLAEDRSNQARTQIELNDIARNRRETSVEKTLRLVCGNFIKFEVQL